MNKVILMGRLTRDPEVRYAQNENNTAVARFSLAVDRRFKRDGEPDADFFNCTAFGKQAEFVEKYLRKGTKMLITGRIQNDNYTNKDGQTVYSVRVMVEEMEFAESKNAAGNGSGADPNPAPAPAPSDSAPTGNALPQAGDGFMNIPDGIDEELPFN